MNGCTRHLEALCQDDPLTNQAYDHDPWLELPLVWARVHYLPRSTLFVPEDEDFARDLANGRMTLLLDADGNPTWVEDTWRTEGSKELDRTFTGATLFEKLNYPLDVEPADPGHLPAQRPRGLPVSTEPTDLERMEHSLTHLPFRSWCPVCVQAKSRQNQSRTLSLKQPVVQVDFAFVSDKVGGPSITLLNAVDALTGLGLSVAVPTNGRSTYSQAELRRFILETGRTFGVLQCDPEPALKALAETVTSDWCFCSRSFVHLADQVSDGLHVASRKSPHQLPQVVYARSTTLASHRLDFQRQVHLERRQAVQKCPLPVRPCLASSPPPTQVPVLQGWTEV